MAWKEVRSIVKTGDCEDMGVGNVKSMSLIAETLWK